ncbi:hypothetical protein NTGHW29_820018 [Candidatus Nitrotoga sp. HW29]|nr:hypothetical protein NTGHW29_820018 [Candidatus Nitrotoga sp. HW29]
MIDKKAQIVRNKVTVVDPDVVTMANDAGLCDFPLITINGEGRGAVVYGDSSRFKGSEDARESSLTRIVPPIDDVQALEILNIAGIVPEALLPTEAAKATEVADVNMSNHCCPLLVRRLLRDTYWRIGSGYPSPCAYTRHLGSRSLPGQLDSFVILCAFL